MARASATRALLLAALAFAPAAAVDRSKFRTCEQASFCRRHRSVEAEPEVRGRLARRAAPARAAPRRVALPPASSHRTRRARPPPTPARSSACRPTL